jgi:antitoxin component of RelBE/YafQ-DinJ toxin-antitoxin module
MPQSTGEKDTYFNIRVSQKMKVAFQKVAKKRGVKMSSLILNFVESEIEKEGVSINNIVPENQISIFDNTADANN